MGLDKHNFNLNRVIARAGLDGKKKEMHLIHFEGPSDWDFFSKYISVKKISVPRNTKCVFTESKGGAINAHKKVLQRGINIVTIVDMDYDYDEKEIFGIENIFTTKCACTLLTMQFQEVIGLGILSEDLNEQSIYDFLENYQNVNKKLILDEVVKKTFKKLKDGFIREEKKKTGKKGNYYRHEKELKINGIKQPINDHVLVSVISNHINPDATKKELKKIRDDLRRSALEDKNESIHWLMSKVLMSLGKA